MRRFVVHFERRGAADELVVLAASAADAVRTVSVHFPCSPVLVACRILPDPSAN